MRTVRGRSLAAMLLIACSSQVIGAEPSEAVMSAGVETQDVPLAPDPVNGDMSILSGATATPQGAGSRPFLYVVDGTGTVLANYSALHHVYDMVKVGQNKFYYDGPNLLGTDDDNIYQTVVADICRAQSYYGQTSAVLLGYSRGALIALNAANWVAANCGVHVQVLGLIDPVNTGMPTGEFASKLRASVPYQVDIHKYHTSENVVTTDPIANITTVANPVQSANHHDMSCPMTSDPNTNGARWNINRLIGLIHAAGIPTTTNYYDPDGDYSSC